MLCERHVQKAMDEREDEDGDEDAFGLAGDRTTVALKRVTRFIDLAALGPVRTAYTTAEASGSSLLCIAMRFLPVLFSPTPVSSAASSVRPLGTRRNDCLFSLLAFLFLDGTAWTFTRTLYFLRPFRSIYLSVPTTTTSTPHASLLT
ncbi:hypothetical protein NUW54_g11529 [Trametes sanguinea]|uniref:Uncharacterized protein n=1 Tax=Trametes sanguinea TaxID=158606 RepID=A0ACC1NCR3_9APHY|nr:hypothetical protein NUW54_g11529 [Trametes sanguinea]